MIRPAIALAALAACTPGKPADTVDAVAACAPDPGFQPIAVMGGTPAGPLAMFHFSDTHYVGGFCPEAYVILLAPTSASQECNYDTRLELGALGPFGSAPIESGTFPAFAYLDNYPWPPGSNMDVTFEVTHVDPPTMPAARFAGRFVSSAPGWSIDVSVDQVSLGFVDCPP